MSGRNLGLLGELALSTWCAQVGIVANKSEQDLTGWDYILEFPITSGSEKVSLIDKEPFPLRCFIQVKSTDDNPGKWDVKLDNWLRLVKNPLPCFFLVLEFENQTECQRAYLVHVDKKYITQVLKRLRKASALKTKELHEMTMRFNYSPLDLVSSLNGHGLSEAIHKHVSISPEEYAAQKQQVISTVGYEEGNWTINVDFLPPPNSTDPREVLVDFLLGKVTHLETIKMKITDLRFGIIVPETQRIIEERGRLEVERKSIGKGTVKVRIPGARDEVRIETEIFVPQGLKGVLPDKYLKVRFAAPFIDFFLWPRYNSECSFTFRLPDIFERHQLRRLQIISKLLQLLHQSALNNQGIEIEMLFESKPLNVGRSNYIPSIDEELVEISETLQQAWQIAQYFDLDQNIEVIPIELMHQRDPIKFLSGILGREKSYFRIDMLLDNDINDNDLYCVPLAGSVRLGETRLFVAVALLGKLELLGASEENRSQYRLQVDHVEVCKQYVFDINEEKTPTIDILKQIVIEKYNEKATIVSLENY